MPAMSLSEGITWREAEWRRIQSTGFSLQQLVLMAEAYGAAPKLIGLTTGGSVRRRTAIGPSSADNGSPFQCLTGMAGDR